MPDQWTGTVTQHSAVGVRVALNTGFHAARARLKILANGGTLPRACEVAYSEGITGLAELAGPSAGLTRLAGVCLEDLTETDDCAHIALQWEAIAADGKLFTALLADLMLLPAGDQVTALSVTGTYWPPPGQAGAGPGPAIVRRCATAVIGSFVDSLACELAHPAGIAGLLAGQRRWPLPRTTRKSAGGHRPAVTPGRPVGRAPAGFTGLADQVRLLLAGSGAAPTRP